MTTAGDHRPLFVVTSRDRRGGQVAATVLAEGLVKRGMPIEIVALVSQGSGLPIAALGSSRFRVTTLYKLRGLMTENRLVVGFGSSTLPACSLAGMGTGSRFVYRSIGDPLYWCNTPARRARTALALRRAHQVAVLWDGAAASFRNVLGVPAERILSIPNGVDDHRFSPATTPQRLVARARFGLPDRAPVVLYLGSLSREKRVDLAISAVGKMGDAHLLIAGDGPLRAELEIAGTSALGARCRFTGTVPAEDALAAADVLLLPSETEGMPAVVIEAAFAGVPSVATDVGALREIVRHGITGQLISVESTPTQVASALDTVLAEAPSQGTAARAHCTGRYDLSTVTETWANFLAQMAADTGHS